MTSSIREFCELDMPVFMHDKHGKYVVMTLEQAGSPSPDRSTVQLFTDDTEAPANVVRPRCSTTIVKVTPWVKRQSERSPGRTGDVAIYQSGCDDIME